MPQISVIVPVYNAEKYLHECVESILSQTYPDFEIILINDGSADNSGRMCDEYAAMDSRVRVYHKANGGVSSARNKGIDVATGEWITFVDSDDYILPEMFERLIIGDEDLKICGYFDQTRKDIPSDYVYNTIAECADYMDREYRHNYINAPWAKLFKTSIIKDNNLRFDETLSLGEDTVYVLYYYYYYCKSVRTINSAMYYYNRPDSLAAKYGFTARKMNDYLSGLHKAICTLECGCGRNLKSIHSWINYDCFNRFNEYLGMCNRKQYCREISYYRKYCFKFRPRMSCKELIYLWLQMLFPIFFYKGDK